MVVIRRDRAGVQARLAGLGPRAAWSRRSGRIVLLPDVPRRSGDVVVGETRQRVERQLSASVVLRENTVQREGVEVGIEPQVARDALHRGDRAALAVLELVAEEDRLNEIRLALARDYLRSESAEPGEDPS